MFKMLVACCIVSVFVCADASDVGDTHLDYHCIVGGPALTVHNAFQRASGKWLVYGEDRRLWQWNGKWWDALTSSRSFQSRPNIAGAVRNPTSKDWFVFSRDGRVFVSRYTIGHDLEVKRTLPFDLLRVRAYEGNAVMLSTDGTLYIASSTGNAPRKLLKVEFQPTELLLSGNTVAIVGARGEYSLFDMSSESTLIQKELPVDTTTATSVSLVDSTLYVVQAQEVLVFAPPFYENPKVVPTPFSARTVSVSTTGSIAVSATSVVATSIDGGDTWVVTNFDDWNINGATAGSGEFCVYGELGEVRFSTNGEEWNNNRLDFKRRVQYLMYSDEQRTYAVYNNQFWWWNTFAQPRLADISESVSFDTVFDLVAYYPGDVMFRNSDTTIVDVSLHSESYTTYSIGDTCLSYLAIDKDGLLALTPSSIQKWVDGELIAEYSLPVDCVVDSTSTIAMIEDQYKVFVFTKNQRWESQFVDEPLQLVATYPETIDVFYRSHENFAYQVVDSVYIFERTRTYGYKGKAMGCVSTWNNTFQDLGVYTETKFNKERFDEVQLTIPAVPTPRVSSFHISRARIPCDSATLAVIYMEGPALSVQDKLQETTMTIKQVDANRDKLVFEVSDQVDMSHLSWRLVDLTGKVLGTSLMQHVGKKANIQVGPVQQSGLYLFSATNARGETAVLKILVE